MVIIKPNGISICLFSHLELNQHQQFNQHTTLCHLFTTNDLFCIAQFGTVYRRIVLIYNAIGPLFLPTAVHRPLHADLPCRYFSAPFNINGRVHCPGRVIFFCTPIVVINMRPPPTPPKRSHWHWLSLQPHIMTTLDRRSRERLLLPLHLVWCGSDNSAYLLFMNAVCNVIIS